MLLNAINYHSMDDRTPENSWGAGTDRERKLFFANELWYKIWGTKYISLTAAAVGNSFVGISSLDRLHGFEVGLYDDSIAPALVDFIRDDEDQLRGYVTKHGDHPQGNLPSEFVEAVFSAGLECGWIYSDLCNSNVVEINGNYSLIDLDTHLVSVEDFDVPFEKQYGCLREHIDPYFRSLAFKRFGRE